MGASPAELACAIHVLPENDAPAINTPSEIVSTEDSPVKLRGLFVTDVDADEIDGSLLLFSVSATVGTLEYGHNSIGINSTIAKWGIRFLDGTIGKNLRIEGGLMRINRALEDLSWIPPTDWNGNATIDFTVNDYGNSGAGGELSGSETIIISVEPVNDAPRITFEESRKATLHFEENSIAHLDEMNIVDIDASANDDILVYISVERGNVSLGFPVKNDKYELLGGAVGGSKLLISAPVSTELPFVPQRNKRPDSRILVVEVAKFRLERSCFPLKPTRNCK